MPEFLPGAVFSGLATVVFVSVLSPRAGKPRLPVWALALIGIAAAFVIPWALALSAAAWRATPALPTLPVVTFDQVFIGVLVALAVLALSHRPNHDDHQDKTVTIVVDGTPYEVPKKEEVTYDEIVTLAYPDHPQHPEITYSVTYSRGHGHNPEGILPPGGSVKVKEGMRFRVDRTGQS